MKNWLIFVLAFRRSIKHILVTAPPVIEKKKGLLGKVILEPQYTHLIHIHTYSQCVLHIHIYGVPEMRNPVALRCCANHASCCHGRTQPQGLRSDRYVTKGGAHLYIIWLIDYIFDQSDEKTWPDQKKTKTNTLREHLQRAIFYTCDV